MDNAGYTTLARQTGLMREIRVIANNVANMNTTGFRAQNMIFSEYVKSTDSAADSLSMSTGRIAIPLSDQGNISLTGGALDLAIEGDGFFLIATPDGERLTRAGHFTTTATGDLVNQDGYNVLDAGGTPVFVPPSANGVSIGADGTLSADGQPIGRIALVRPEDPLSLLHTGGTSFATEAWQPDETSRIRQGALEDSNVNVVTQMARMIEVQRAYELGQKFLDQEDERMKSVIKTLSR